MSIESSLAFLILMFFAMPLTTLLHELGHALAGLSVGAPRATAQLGSPPRSTKTVFALDVGRIRIQFTGWMALWFGFAWMDDPPPLTSRQKAWVLLAGPLTSLVMVILLATLAFLTRGNTSQFVRVVVQYTAMYAFGSLLMTAIPMRYPAWMGAYAGHQSDMARALDLLRGGGA